MDLTPSSSDHRESTPGGVKHRHRTPISCSQCRRRKIRCDRQFPCGPCLARDAADSCQYEGGPPTESNVYLRQRIIELEDQVLFLQKQIGNHRNSPIASSSSGNPGDTEPVDRELLAATAAFGSLKIGTNNETRFFGMAITPLCNC